MPRSSRDSSKQIPVDLLSPSVRLVGREPEMEIMEAELRTIASGRFRCLLVDGPAGVGKTRLIAELIDRNEDEFTVLSARSYRLGSVSSFGPWLEAFDRYALSEGEVEVHRLIGADGRERLHRDILLEKMTSALVKLSDQTPVLVAIDDIHLSDDSSWEALRFLARRLSDRQIGVLAAARPGGLRTNPLANDVMLALADDGMLRRINVRPLNPVEVSELVMNRLRAQPGAAPSGATPQALVQWLHERSLGHPLFVLSLLQALLDQGADLSAPSLTKLPNSLRDRVEAELPVLDAGTREVLEVLSVMDRKANPLEIAEVVGRSLEEVGELLQDLRDSNLVTEEVAGFGFIYEVAHPLIQESTYELISGARRMSLHRAVARAFLEQDRWGAAAAHFARSSLHADDESIDALCRAITEAESKGLYREALAILSGLEELIEPGDRRWLKVLDAIRWQADWVVDHLVESDAHGAIAVMRRIEEVARKDRDVIAQGIVQFHLASFLAIGAGRFEEAEDACRRAIELFREAGERHRELLSQNELVWISSCAGKLEEASRLANTLLAEIDDDVDVQVTNQIAGSRAYALGLMGKFEESRALYGRATDIALQRGMAYRRIWGLVQESQVSFLAGDLDGSNEQIEEALQLDYVMACDALALERLAHNRWMQGNLSECVRLIDESGARRAVRGSRRRAWGLAVAARALGDLGQVSRASRYLDQARETYTGEEILDWSSWCHWAGGYLSYLEGDHTTAVERYELAIQRYRKMGARGIEGLVLVDLAEAGLAADDPVLTSMAATRMRDIASEIGSRLHSTLVEFLDAIGEYSHGARPGETFVEVSKTLESAGYLLMAESAAHLGGLCLRESDHEEAMGVLEWAARIADRSGSSWRRERSSRALSEMGALGRRVVGAILGPESLTPREREVALFAARGFTARQIADQLFIATRTVESHLANIYPKLGVASKRELVIRGEELGLTDASA